jgi:nicotinate-nucleotide adenylyltransferase
LNRLGLFGGRFDPVHRAHMAMARAAADALDLQEVRWIVSGDPEHKPAVAPAADRLAMTRLAVQEMRDSRMQVDDREIRAAQQGGSNYTADTIMGLQRELPGPSLVWILGGDQLADFMSWSRWEWLVGQMAIAVCARPGSEVATAEQAIMARGGRVHRIAMARDDVSSTAIRKAIAQKESIAGLVPPPVLDYIVNHHLYH